MAPPDDNASISLLRSILGRPSEDSELASAPDEDNLPRLLANPRFQELVEIVNLAVQVHGAGARDWFSRPEPELGFVLPVTLMRDPANGRKLVKQSLMNHLKGMYALGQDDRVLPRPQTVIAPGREPAKLGKSKGKRRSASRRR
jgi:hypothetical protein